MKDVMDAGRRSRKNVSYCEELPFINEDDEEWEQAEDFPESEDGIHISFNY